MRPDISIIMPAYNTAPWIGQAVESVLVQKGPSWELLIIDDGSTDATPGIAAGYAALDNRIRLLRNENIKGAGGARNTGLAQIRGGAVAFLDSDDVFLPGALAALHGKLLDSGEPVVRGVGKNLCMQRWLISGRPLPPECGKTGRERTSYPQSTFWLHMFQADFLRRNGILFAEDLMPGEDFYFLCRVHALLDSLPVVEQPIHLYRYNHKKSGLLPPHAHSYLKLAFKVRALFGGSAKDNQIAPCINSFFLSRWPHCLYAVRQSGKEQALIYLTLCLALFDERREVFEPVLGRSLAGAAEEFFSLWGKKDIQGLLALLEEHDLLSPQMSFAGIAQRPEETFWPAYTLPRRLLNCLRDPETPRALFYLALLRLRSQKRLRRSGKNGDFTGGCKNAPRPAAKTTVKEPPQTMRETAAMSRPAEKTELKRQGRPT